jgi:hypothetical protein
MSPMPWTQLRSSLNEFVAHGLKGRLAIHQARYRYTREEVGRVWVTLDGQELISFDTSRYVARRAQLAHDMRSGIGPFALSATSDYAEYHAADAAACAALREAGEYDDYSALVDLEAYLSLPIGEALVSPSPLIRALAVIDRRVGKRRLRGMRPMSDEHALVKSLFAARCEAEGIEITRVN